MTPEKIGRNIRAAREAKGLEQKECASKLPCAASTWSDWESGKMAPRLHRLPRIAKLLGTKVSELLA